MSKAFQGSRVHGAETKRFVSWWIVGEKTAGAEPSCNKDVAMPLVSRHGPIMDPKWIEMEIHMDMNNTSIVFNDFPMV